MEAEDLLLGIKLKAHCRDTALWPVKKLNTG